MLFGQNRTETLQIALISISLFVLWTPQCQRKWHKVSENGMLLITFIPCQPELLAVMTVCRCQMNPAKCRSDFARPRIWFIYIFASRLSIKNRNKIDNKNALPHTISGQHRIGNRKILSSLASRACQLTYIQQSVFKHSPIFQIPLTLPVVRYDLYQCGSGGVRQFEYQTSQIPVIISRGWLPTLSMQCFFFFFFDSGLYSLYLSQLSHYARNNVLVYFDINKNSFTQKMAEVPVAFWISACQSDFVE